MIEQLFKAYNLSAATPNDEMPSSTTPSDLALESIFKLLSHIYQMMPIYTIYCHETTEPSFHLTPSLKIKRDSLLKKTLPFSVSSNGSASWIAALEMLCALCSDLNADCPSLVVTTDVITSPQPHKFWDAYSYEDASSACIFNITHGEWEIINFSMAVWTESTSNSYEWTQSQYLQFEGNLIKQSIITVEKLLSTTLLEISQIKFIIAQRYSSMFLKQLSNRFGTSTIFNRATQPEVNYLTSDCLISLYELEQTGNIRKGDIVLMISAGATPVTGVVILKKT